MIKWIDEPPTIGEEQEDMMVKPEEGHKQVPQETRPIRTNSQQKNRHRNLGELLFGDLTSRRRQRAESQKLNSTSLRRSLGHFKLVLQSEKGKGTETQDMGSGRLFTSQLSAEQRRRAVRAYVPLLG